MLQEKRLKNISQQQELVKIISYEQLRKILMIRYLKEVQQSRIYGCLHMIVKVGYLMWLRILVFLLKWTRSLVYQFFHQKNCQQSDILLKKNQQHTIQNIIQMMLIMQQKWQKKLQMNLLCNLVQPKMTSKRMTEKLLKCKKHITKLF